MARIADRRYIGLRSRSTVRTVSARRLDLALAVGLTLAMQASIWIFDAVPGEKALLCPLYLLVSVPLYWRRVHPLLVAFLGALPEAIQALVTHNGVTGGVTMVCGVIAVYSLGAYGRLRDAAVALPVGAAAFAIHDANTPTVLHDTFASNAFFWLLVITIWLAGVYVGRHREAAGLRKRAAELERDQQERAREAVAEERIRIARELHDVIAHSVSVMVVQADAAEEVLNQDPARARASLRNIQRAGRESLEELQRLLGVINDDRGNPGLKKPQPGVGQLEALLEALRGAGLTVELDISGVRRSLPPGVDLSAYRIVQEALTNVLRHAGATHAEVLVRFGAQSLELEVLDNGQERLNGNGMGRGLIGMRERASLYGGEVEAGPRREGGFAVRARLPISRVSP